MDILLCETFTAEESIAHTRKEVEKLKPDEETRRLWEGCFEEFREDVVPRLRERAWELLDAKGRRRNWRSGPWEPAA